MLLLRCSFYCSDFLLSYCSTAAPAAAVVATAAMTAAAYAAWEGENRPQPQAIATQQQEHRHDAFGNRRMCCSIEAVSGIVEIEALHRRAPGTGHQQQVYFDAVAGLPNV